MKIDVKITSLMPGDGNVKASATANIDDCIAIRNIKVMSGRNGLFASMPSYLAADNKYYDICFPLTKELREEFNSAVINAYHQTIAQMQEQNSANFSRSEQMNEPAPTMSM